MRGRRTTRLVLAAACLASLALAGCSRIPGAGLFARAVPEAPLPFAAEVRAPRGSPDFAVLVDARGAGLERIRESVRYPGTRYCLRNFGSTEIVWRSAGGPDNWTSRRLTSGRLLFSGRCLSR